MKDSMEQVTGVDLQKQADKALAQLEKTNPKIAEILRRNMEKTKGGPLKITPQMLADAQSHENRNEHRTDD